MATPLGETWTTMNSADVAAFVARFLETSSAKRRVESVLDAGSGHGLPFRLPNGARVTGLDVSEASLAENHLLDARIVGDVEAYPLPSEHFDTVVCWNVLEHLPRPITALSNLHSTLRPDGLLILSIPNLTTPKTLLTKFTPHWFHIWVYRRVLGNASAGLPGHAPFHTYLRLDLFPRRLRRTLEDLGFLVETEIRYSSGMVSAIVGRNLALRIGWKIVGALWRRFGVDPELSDVAWILRKRTGATAGMSIS